MSDTIDPETIRAYRETGYRVHGTPGFVLHVDTASPELHALHQLHQVRASAYLTACNPESRQLDPDDNATRQRALSDVLAARGVVALDGLGRHPTNGWPGEHSLLALGLDFDSACELGCQFGQNAILWAGADAVPRLILLR